MMIRRNNVAIRESNDNIDHKKMVITQARSQEWGGGGGGRTPPACPTYISLVCPKQKTCLF